MAKKDEKNTGVAGAASTGAGASEGQSTQPPQVIQVDAAMLLRLQDQIDTLKAQNDKLIAVADKGRLARYDQLHNPGEVLKTAKISFLDGKMVKGWRMVENDVYIDPRGIYHEKQTVELFFDDASSEKIEYVDSVRRIKKEVGEILSRSFDKQGNEILKMMMKDGREMEIDIKFVN